MGQEFETRKENRFLCKIEGLPDYCIKAVRGIQPYLKGVTQYTFEIDLFDPVEIDVLEMSLKLANTDSKYDAVITELSATGRKLNEIRYVDCAIDEIIRSDLDWKNDEVSNITIKFTAKEFLYKSLLGQVSND